MAVQPLEETISELHDLGRRKGIPVENIERAIRDRENDPKELRALARKWRAEQRAADAKATRDDERRWIEQQAVKSAEMHRELQRELAKDRERDRSRLPVHERLRIALFALSLKSTVGAAQVERAAGGAESRIGPPGLVIEETTVRTGNTIDLGVYERGLLAIIRRIEAIVDADGSDAAQAARLSEEERGLILDGLAGLHSHDVAAWYPWLGGKDSITPRTVERWRKDRAGEKGIKVRPSTGLPVEPKGAA